MFNGTEKRTSGANAGGGSAGGLERPAMLTVVDVARLLSCSPRHVYRLVDMGRLRRPVKLGTLVRWPRSAVLAWIERECPSRTTEGGE
jgi:excisionase family DNA binding protein